MFAAFAVIFCFGFGAVSAGTRDNIANIADGYVGSAEWAFSSERKTGENTNKCNIFVAEVLEEAGASVPHRRWWKWSPIGAGEWGNASSEYLTGSGCWVTVSSPSNGDVAGDGVHVAIVTGSQITTSAARYRVVKNDWGFDSAGRLARVFWRYTC